MLSAPTDFFESNIPNGCKTTKKGREKKKDLQQQLNSNTEKLENYNKLRKKFERNGRLNIL